MNEASQILSRNVLEIGGTSLSLKALISAVAILFLSGLAAWAVRFLVRRAQQRLGDARTSSIYVGGQIFRYLIVFAGLSAAVSTLGVDLSALSLFAGALGVGIGLGLQDVVKNFVCGIILLFDRSIEIGDYIELEDGTSGAVASIGPRATTMVTNDNVDILVPNANLLSGRLTNWTRTHATRRIHVPFNVAYGSDKEVVKAAALEAAGSVAFTMSDEGNRRTQVWLTGFGESALNFSLVVWPTLEAVKRPGSMMAAYCWALDDALRKYGIEIPFPQRDLRVRSVFGHEGQAGIEIMRGSGDTGGDTQRADQSAGRSINDAAEDIGDTGGSA